MKDLNPAILRQVISMLGLGIGFFLYTGALKLPGHWSHAAVGAMFAALGITTFIYGKEKLWIRILGALIVLWGLFRFLFWR